MSEIRTLTTEEMVALYDEESLLRVVLCVIFGWCYGVFKIALMRFCRGFRLVQSEEIEMEQRNERNRTSLPPLIDNY